MEAVDFVRTKCEEKKAESPDARCHFYWDMGSCNAITNADYTESFPYFASCNCTFPNPYAPLVMATPTAVPTPSATPLPTPTAVSMPTPVL